MTKSTQVLFDHVACGVARIDEIAPLLESELGGEPHRGGPGIGFRGGQWVFRGGGRLEIIEPDGEAGGFLHRFLAAHGPGIHHVTFKVPDIHAARDRAASLGYDVVGFSDQYESWKECFLHPKQAGGIVVQMAEVEEDAPDETWLPLRATTDRRPAQAACLRGVRLVSRDAARAARLWVELLGATADDSGPSQKTFRWTGSPLALRVNFDPRTETEGPVALEFEGSTPDFPSEVAGLLGTPLARI